MRMKNMKSATLRRRLAGVVASAVLLLVVGPGSSSAQEPQPKTFPSPVEASNALFQAAQGEDEQALEAILGARTEVTSSGDEVEDKLEREQFTKKYQEMHRLVREPDGSIVLYVGAENWPFPIPLVSNNGEWYFNSDRGKQEILFRRIGENEMTAIAVCEEFALTQTEDSANLAGELKAASEDPITRFAQSLVSAGASNVGITSGATEDRNSYLFHGYYFRRITGDSVVVGGKKKGLALVAYPADYGSSGVKTFLVTQRGIVFEKDLGPDTTIVAPISSLRTSGWRPAE